MNYSNFILKNKRQTKEYPRTAKRAKPQRKNKTDEFLVEKKLPLSMPPDFEKLPIPKNEKVVDNDIEENNIKKLIVKS